MHLIFTEVKKKKSKQMQYKNAIQKTQPYFVPVNVLVDVFPVVSVSACPHETGSSMLEVIK